MGTETLYESLLFSEQNNNWYKIGKEKFDDLYINDFS